MPRTKPADERRSDLLDAAQAVFVDKGVAATTLEDITARAGVAKGTFYLYFRSKDDIVSALQRRFGDQFADRLARAAASKGDWVAKLDALVTACFTNYASQYDLHDVLFHHPGASSTHSDGDDHEPSPSRITDVIGDVLSDGVAAGAYQVDDVELTAILVYSAIHGAFEAHCHGPRRPAKARFVRATQQLVRRAAGIAGTP